MLATNATRSEGSEDIARAHVEELRDRLSYLAGNPRALDRRLEDLDEEWDIERAIQANAATLALTGTALSLVHDRRWSALPLAVTGFLLQHALQGWCPPVPILRRMGFRTQPEIERERHALKALRGDYDALGREENMWGRADAAFDATR